MKPTARSCSRLRLASTTFSHCAKHLRFMVILVTVRFITMRWSCSPMRSDSCTYTLLECMACSPTYTLRKFPKKLSTARSRRCRDSAPYRYVWNPVSITCINWNTRNARSPSSVSCGSALEHDSLPRTTAPTMYTSHVRRPSTMDSAVGSAPGCMLVQWLNSAMAGSSSAVRNVTVVSYRNRHRCGRDSSWSCSCSSLSSGSSDAVELATAVTLSSREVMNVSVMRGT
mmetsp:Transcript_14897/g.36029  ORF Transcript_14897/g.36029 Transcript_14897/m.36029 type:complete len:228 (+) Transcript_14897:1381-2064(+)